VFAYAVLLLTIYIFTTSYKNKSMSANSSKNSLSFKIVPNTNRAYNIVEDKTILSTNQLAGRSNKLANTLQSHTNIDIRFSFLKELSNRDSTGAFVSYKSDMHYLNNDSISTKLSDLSEFKDAMFNISFRAQGKVNTISGYDEFKKKYAEVYLNELKKKYDEEQWPAVPSRDGVIFKEAYFIDLFERISNILPDSKIQLNSKWTKIESQDIGEKKLLHTEYTFYKIESGVAFIKSSANIQESIPSNVHIMKVEGTEQGELELDVNSGMLIKSEKKMTTHGVTKIGKSDFSVTVNRTTTIKSTVLANPKN
jgi:hypothetical protein